MNIRQIVENDNEQVKTLIQSIMTEYDCVGCGFSIEDAEVIAMYSAYNKPGHIFYVIEDDNNSILGCGGIGSLTGGTGEECELKKMYFYPELRGKGLGSKLINMLLDFASKHYKVVYIETMQNMQEARKLYEKNGFKYLDKGLGNTGHFNCDTYMVLELG